MREGMAKYVKGGSSMRKYFLAWFGMLVLAIANGALRQAALVPVFGDLTAHQISSATLIIIFCVYFWILSGRWKIGSAKEAWRIGVMWRYKRP